MILFESHATSIDNQNEKASGWLDPNLALVGLTQAQELGKRYMQDNISIIYVSDLIRSQRTAEIAFKSRNIPIIMDPRLREWNYGEYNGYSAEQVESLKLSYIHTPFPKGESLSDVMQRFASFKTDNLKNLDGKIVLIIGHRATFYSMEYFFNHTPLHIVLSCKWEWLPKRMYYSS
ncbi:MAG: histidine phosphatase family protein [Chlamydiia bacterium]|nr:histidine phosphatase family protein [Chlamydiia bacterium]